MGRSVIGSTSVGQPVTVLLNAWRRGLRGSGRAEETVRAYTISVRQFAAFLDRRGMPTHVDGISREHVEEWLVELRETRSPATCQIRFRGLVAYFKFLLEEGELVRSPLERVKRPKGKSAPPDVLTEDQVKALIRACDGSSFLDRRDMAIIRVLLDTGIRRGECACPRPRLAIIALVRN